MAQRIPLGKHPRGFLSLVKKIAERSVSYYFTGDGKA